jgi:hypothetical protein
MARKPDGDLGSTAISKVRAADMVPFSTPPAAAAFSSPVLAPAKSLTVKLDGETYAALHAHCYQQERVTGRRVTHQDVVGKLVMNFLGTEART